MKNILIVEDDLITALILKRGLIKAGYGVTVANDGREAIEHLKKESFDAILTDWMMPFVNGIELIKYVRKNTKPSPYIMLITALASKESEQKALDSGADDFITKPIRIADLIERLEDGLNRNSAQNTVTNIKIKKVETDVSPPHICVAIAASTGGPPTLIHLFETLQWKENAAFLLVQHGPAWMLEAFSERLAKAAGMNVHLVNNRLQITPGNIYIAPGEKHIRVDKSSYHIISDSGPKENFVRPAADPLFRSVAEAYGKYGIAVVLTGLGKDGASGSANIAAVKGTILVQDPATCIAPSMPRAVIEANIPCKVIPYERLPKELSETIYPTFASWRRGK